MRPRHALTGAVAVVGALALAWCGWLVLRADLTPGTKAASAALWLLAAVAVVTLTLYVREVERHRVRTGHSSWEPLPGLVLLWVAGLTAMAAFPFMLPGGSGPDGGKRQAVAPSSSTTTPSTTTSSTTSASTSVTPSWTSAPRSTDRTLTSQATIAVPQPVGTTPSSTSSSTASASATKRPASTSTGTSTPTVTSSTTTTPTVDVTSSTPTKTKRP